MAHTPLRPPRAPIPAPEPPQPPGTPVPLAPITQPATPVGGTPPHGSEDPVRSTRTW